MEIPFTIAFLTHRPLAILIAVRLTCLVYYVSARLDFADAVCGWV
jgi:hypothetical protein